MELKGIIMAGGKGNRLHPMTWCISKHLLPVYDKPMIFYPMATLISFGIRRIMIITHPRDLENYRLLLGDGRDFGIELTYALQPEPKGIAEAFYIAKDFLNGSPSLLILGDNIFLGDLYHKIEQPLKRVRGGEAGAVIFGYRVEQPKEFGVVEVSYEGGEAKVKGLEEKPLRPKSNWAATGMYLYDGDVCRMMGEMEPSAAGELEITDLNRLYLAKGHLRVALLDGDIFWQDAGTPEGMFKASEGVRRCMGEKSRPGAIEAEAFIQGWMTVSMMESRADWYDGSSSGGHNEYAGYLRSLIGNGDTHVG